MVSSDRLFAPYPSGTVLGGRYRIVNMIGRGGMGVVYAADDLKLAGKLRAVKVIAPASGGDGGSYAGEAHMMMKVRHPHLPVIVDYFPPHEQSCEALVMEYIDGHTVADLFRSSHSGLTFIQIIHIGIQLCSALSYLHSHAPPIIHRDLKPTNVMIDRKWHVKLIDFSISRQFKAGQQQDTAQLGTFGFAAPEQGGTGQSDERTDVYGLGALLYFMASGGIIFQRTAGSKGGPEPLSNLQPDIPNAFKVVLRRLLQTDPQFRYRTMLEVEEAIRPFASPLLTVPLNAGNVINTQSHPICRMLICLLSLAPGAGATFLSHTLAALLGLQGISVTAAEYEHARPEWHAWLSGHKRLRNDEWEERAALDKRYVSYKQDELSVNWFALQPGQRPESTLDEQRFVLMLRHAGGLINLIDLSCSWNEPHALQLLKQARYVFVVGDPAVAKWQAGELKQLAALRQELQTLGGNMTFIANKDLAFHGRNEWLSLFPERPLAIIPRLPEEKILALQWNGRWATDDSRLRKRLHQALLPIIKLLYNHISTD